MNVSPQSSKAEKRKQQSRKIPLFTYVCTDVDNVRLVILTKTSLWAGIKSNPRRGKKKTTFQLNPAYRLSFYRRAHLAAAQY